MPIIPIHAGNFARFKHSIIIASKGHFYFIFIQCMPMGWDLDTTYVNVGKCNFHEHDVITYNYSQNVKHGDSVSYFKFRLKQ